MGNHQPGFRINLNRAVDSNALTFTLQRLVIIVTELDRVNTEHSEYGWIINPSAADIVGYMEN